MNIFNVGQQKAITKTGVVHGSANASGRFMVRSGGRNVMAKALGTPPGPNARVVLIESNGEQFIVGSDELRKQLTREYIIDG